MLCTRFAASAATLSFVIAPLAARADLPGSSCWRPGEAPAASMFAFTTMLAVGALKCRTSNDTIVSAYDGFAGSRAALIAANAERVKAHFIADRGAAAGIDAFSDYETGLANRYSSDALYDRGCATMAAYTQLATRATETDLIALAQAIDRNPPAVCEAAPVRAPAFAATVPVAPVVSAIGDGSTIGSAVPAERVTLVSPAAAAQAAPPTAASALADAARALASAAAALEAQSRTPSAP